MPKFAYYVRVCVPRCRSSSSALSSNLTARTREFRTCYIKARSAPLVQLPGRSSDYKEQTQGAALPSSISWFQGAAPSLVQILDINCDVIWYRQRSPNSSPKQRNTTMADEVRSTRLSEDPPKTANQPQGGPHFEALKGTN